MATRYAQIVDGVVHLVTESETQPDAQHGIWIACGNAGPGWTTTDGVTFTAPVVVAPVVTRHITQLAFLSRFADAEAVAIDLASIGATVQAASMRRFQSKVNAATYIDLDRADTRAGVHALETGGLLATGRAAVILDTAVADAERYRG